MAYKTIAQREQERREALQQDPANIQLDWRAYFLEFMCVHGGDPVVEGNRLLFRDGFMHAIDDYQGPEWKAPDDPRELHRLQVVYWTKRSQMLTAEVRRLVQAVENHHAMQQGRSARLWEQSFVRDEEGRVTLTSAPFDVDKYRGRILACKRAEVEARLKLRELTKGSSNATEPARGD